MRVGERKKGLPRRNEEREERNKIFSCMPTDIWGLSWKLIRREQKLVHLTNWEMLRLLVQLF